MEFEHAAAILKAVGLAEASESMLDVEELAAELDQHPDVLSARLQELETYGLIVAGFDDARPPILLSAGRQYLGNHGRIDHDVLVFLPHTFDNLHTRRAVLNAGSVLIDEFGYQLAHGRAREHAQELVPPAFAESVTERLAVDLFAAAVALLARLSAGLPAGCVAEEILAVGLIDQAAAWLEIEADTGLLSADDARAATSELQSMFELFQDDDVLNMFNMKEPADAAVQGQSPVASQLGIADQRLAAWFEPFWGFPATGHLASEEDRPRTESGPSARLLTPLSPAPVTLEPSFSSSRFRVVIRLWEDSSRAGPQNDRMPVSWTYHVTAASAEQARRRALQMFPSGATVSPAFDDRESATLEDPEIARLAVDVQRVGLAQSLKPDAQYHIVAQLDLEDEATLRLLAGHLTAIFPAAVVATDSSGSFFGVTVNAESFEEADADLEDQLTSFAELNGLDQVLPVASSTGIGGLDADELLQEIERYPEIDDGGR